MKNGKKNALLLLCALLICALTGCAMVQTEFEFEPDGGFSVSEGIYLRKEFFDLMQQTPEEYFTSEDLDDEGLSPEDIVCTESNGMTYYGVKDGLTFDSVKAFENYYDVDDIPWQAKEYTDEDGRRVASVSYTIMSNEQALDELGVDPAEQELTYSGASSLVYVSLKCTFPGGVKNVIGMNPDAYTVSGNSVELKIESSDMEWTVIVEGYLDEAEGAEEPAVVGDKKYTPFTDVPKDAYYYDATVWAYTAQPQITDGNGKDKFLPEQICTRGQVVTFLWRAMGEPEPGSGKNPFVDVTGDDWFYEPVLWAVENGITEGTDATHFSPNDPCRNSHILTFIYRAMGEPNKTDNPVWYSDAYNWANFGGLLEGTYTGTFDVNAQCPRKNVVQYLYRYYTMK